MNLLEVLIAHLCQQHIGPGLASHLCRMLLRTNHASRAPLCRRAVRMSDVVRGACVCRTCSHGGAARADRRVGWHGSTKGVRFRKYSL